MAIERGLGMSVSKMLCFHCVGGDTGDDITKNLCISIVLREIREISDPRRLLGPGAKEKLSEPESPECPATQ